MEVKVNEWKGKDEFLKTCFQRFGSMNKNDYEVALFHLLMQNEDYALKSDFEMSMYLQIPESKVKRLRYEESLVFQRFSKNYNDQLAELLLKGKYRVHNERIQFAISDKHFRLYINDMLIKDGRFADSSFNSSIVSLTATDLLYLLEKINKKSAENLKKIRKDIEDGKRELEKNVAEAFSELSKDVIKETLRTGMSKELIDSLESFCKTLYSKIGNRQK